ncbi:MAG: DUF1688 family protein [Bdellovibrionales bacterium]|nr:DUF1688 family protein [Bdellovibrionales bacterium]
MIDSHMPFNQKALEEIFAPSRIRSQSLRLQKYCVSGKGHFAICEEVIPEIVAYVNQVIEFRYPNGQIPYHSRFSHFQVGGVDRLAYLEKNLNGLDRLEKVRAKIDLVMVSVLLDAGAGSQWQFFETETGKVVARSEGLAVASLDMFIKGAFRASLKQNCRLMAEACCTSQRSDWNLAFKFLSEIL